MIEAWGCCAAEKKQGRYKKCGSHDDQSWHGNWENSCSVKWGSGEVIFATD